MRQHRMTIVCGFSVVAVIFLRIITLSGCLEIEEGLKQNSENGVLQQPP